MTRKRESGIEQMGAVTKEDIRRGKKLKKREPRGPRVNINIQDIRTAVVEQLESLGMVPALGTPTFVESERSEFGYDPDAVISGTAREVAFEHDSGRVTELILALPPFCLRPGMDQYEETYQITEPRVRVLLRDMGGAQKR